MFLDKGKIATTYYCKIIIELYIYIDILHIVIPLNYNIQGSDSIR